MTHTLICLICNKSFETKDKKRKVCSVECANKYISKIKTGVPRSEETKRKVSKSRKEKYSGKNHPRYGKTLTKETKQKISESLKKTYKHIKHPREGKKHSEYTRKLIGDSRRGKYRRENSPSWQGGKTLKGNFYRSLPEYLDWRKSVFERDEYRCQISGQRGGNLVVHHINSFCDNKDLRLELDNGITMNKKVHKEFHQMYGKGKNNMKQLEEFKQRKYFNIKDTNGLDEKKYLDETHTEMK